MRTLFLALLLLPLGLVAQPEQEGAVFTDTRNDITLRYASSWLITRTSESTVQFQGEGDPIQALWKTQGLDLRCKTVKGYAQSENQGTFELRNASFGGGVVAEIRGQERRSVVRCSVLDYVLRANEALATLRGPLTITSKSQNVLTRLTGPEGAITLDPPDKGSKDPIRFIQISGGATLTQEQNGESTGLTCSSLKLRNGTTEATVDLDGRTTITRKDPKGNRFIQITGSSGEASLPPLSKSEKDPLRSFSLKGPVKLSLTGDSKGKPVRVNGTAESLRYDATNETITLSGNVFMEGNLPTFQGATRADTAMIRLGKDRQVRQIEFKGRPGKSELQEIKDDA